jgi:hypothetical protein
MIAKLRAFKFIPKFFLCNPTYSYAFKFFLTSLSSTTKTQQSLKPDVTTELEMSA